MIDNKENNKITSVLFVCMGNICRSPSAEAVFRHKAKSSGLIITSDSAGTLAYHKGEKPDSRSLGVGEMRGYDFSGIKARKVTVDDFEKFSLLLAMDNENFNDLIQIAPEQHAHKVKLFLDYAHAFEEQEVPDPYYGGKKGFEYVLDLIEEASEGLIKYIKK